MGRVQKAGCVPEEVIKQDLSRGREVLPGYRAALGCCCSAPVPGTVACALCIPGLLLLLQMDPSGSGCFHSWPIHVTLQKKKVLQLRDGFSLLPSASEVLPCDHRVHFCCNAWWGQGVSAPDLFPQQVFASMAPAQLRWAWRDVGFAIPEQNQCGH